MSDTEQSEDAPCEHRELSCRCGAKKYYPSAEYLAEQSNSASDERIGDTDVYPWPKGDLNAMLYAMRRCMWNETEDHKLARRAFTDGWMMHNKYCLDAEIRAEQTEQAYRSLKRYDIVDNQEFENPEGDYVRWDDLKA